MGEGDNKIDVSGYDVFEIVALAASEVNIAEARRDQKNAGRVKFINELVGYLGNYFSAKEVIKPEGYQGVLKSVLHSRTTELMDLIQACQEGKPEKFALLVKEFDRETLRRMGKSPPPEQTSRTPKDVITAADGLRAQDIIDIAGTRRDVRQKSRNLGLN